jgi:dCMP deaminase
MKDFFIKTAFLLAQESHCVSHKVGCVIVKNDRIVSVGYNGTPPGTTNCDDHFSEFLPFDRTAHRAWSNLNEIHAEMNAIAFAAKYGVPLDGCDMYVTLSPCNKCLKSIVSTGIKNLYYYNVYDHCDMNPIMLKQINVEKIKDESGVINTFVELNNLNYKNDRL